MPSETSDWTPDAAPKKPSATNWTEVVQGIAAAQCARLGVAPEHLPAVEKARAKEQWRERFELARIEVLERYGGEIRADAHDAFRRGKLKRTQAINATIEFLRTMRQHGRQVLVLSGDTGLGKTLAALYGLAWYSAAHPTFSFGEHVHATDLAARVKPWTKHEQARALELRRPFVILDDLGIEDHENPRFGEAIDAFFNARQGVVQGTRQVTIVTTNKPFDELVGRYGKRVASRLTGLTRAVDLVGEDLRASGGGR